MTATLHLIPDQDCCNPREENTVGTLLAFSRHTFGDADAERIFRDSIEYAMTDLLRWRRPGLDHSYTAADERLPCPRCREAGAVGRGRHRRTCPTCEGSGEADNPYWIGQPVGTLMRIHDEYEHRIKPAHRLHWLPIYMYEHGDVKLSTTPFSCHWDSSLAGMLFTTGAEIKEMLGVKNLYEGHIKQATDMMTEALPTLQQWINGDCWGFELRVDGEVVGSCWGFYGSDIEENGMAQYLPTNYRELETTMEVATND